MPATQRSELEGAPPAAISRYRERASPLAGATNPGRKMAPIGLFGIHLPSNPVRIIREAHSPVRAGTRCGALGHSAVCRRPGVCRCRPHRRVSGWHLSGDITSPCCTGTTIRSSYFFRFYSVARQWRRKQRTFCRQSCSIIQALGKSVCSHGFNGGIRSGDTEGGPLLVPGLVQRIPILQACTSDA